MCFPHASGPHRPRSYFKRTQQSNTYLANRVSLCNSKAARAANAACAERSRSSAQRCGSARHRIHWRARSSGTKCVSVALDSRDDATNDQRDHICQMCKPRALRCPPSAARADQTRSARVQRMGYQQCTLDSTPRIALFSTYVFQMYSIALRDTRRWRVLQRSARRRQSTRCTPVIWGNAERPRSPEATVRAQAFICSWNVTKQPLTRQGALDTLRC